jgi:hypothetical protein
MKVGDIVAVKNFRTPQNPISQKGIIEDITEEKTVVRLDDNFKITYFNPVNNYDLEPVNCSIGANYHRYLSCPHYPACAVWDLYTNKIINL